MVPHIFSVLMYGFPFINAIPWPYLVEISIYTFVIFPFVYFLLLLSFCQNIKASSKQICFSKKEAGQDLLHFTLILVWVTS